MIGSLLGLSIALQAVQQPRPSSSALYQSCAHVIEQVRTGAGEGLCHYAVAGLLADHSKSPGQPVPPEEIASSFCPPPGNSLSIEDSGPAAEVFVQYVIAHNLTGVTNDDGEAVFLTALVQRWPCIR